MQAKNNKVIIHFTCVDAFYAINITYMVTGPERWAGSGGCMFEPGIEEMH